MGNRAVVTFANKADIQKYIVDGEKLKGFVMDNPNMVGVYLHWNGGRDSIEGFCLACKNLGFRSPVSDCYGIARFVQAVANFFGGSLSVGVDTLERLDTNNYDNGVYVVDDEWNIIGREFHEGDEQKQYNAQEFSEEVIDRMPESYDCNKEKKDKE